MTDVYLHIGLPKTGTTSIQFALQDSTAALAERGVDFTGGRHHMQRMAVYDLIGRRVEGAEAPDVAGAWQRLVDEIDKSRAPVNVVSEENLTLARPRQVRKLLSSLSEHRVFVIVTLRDLGRVIVSSWQNDIIGGHTFSWDEYVAAIRDPAHGPATAGVVFQLRFDLLRILDSWERVLPRDRIRLVTVPPPGSQSGLLLDRFGQVVGLPPGTLRSPTLQRNEGLGAVQTEVLRRLNTALRTELSPAQATAVARHSMRSQPEGQRARPLALPRNDLQWVTDRTRELVAELHARGYEIHGDLKDLDPQAESPGARRLDDVSESELLSATEDALQSLSLEYASLWKRHQRLRARREGEESVSTRLSSSARAAGFGVRAAALDHADSSRFMGWLSRTYVRRSSRR